MNVLNTVRTAGNGTLRGGTPDHLCTTLDEMYNWLASSDGRESDGGPVVAQFNHPGVPTYGRFDEFKHDKRIDDLMALIELGSGVGLDEVDFPYWGSFWNEPWHSITP